jgi:hypothetical protein
MSPVLSVPWRPSRPPGSHHRGRAPATVVRPESMICRAVAWPIDAAVNRSDSAIGIDTSASRPSQGVISPGLRKRAHSRRSVRRSAGFRLRRWPSRFGHYVARRTQVLEDHRNKAGDRTSRHYVGRRSAFRKPHLRETAEVSRVAGSLATRAAVSRSPFFRGEGESGISPGEIAPRTILPRLAAGPGRGFRL